MKNFVEKRENLAIKVVGILKFIKLCKNDTKINIFTDDDVHFFLDKFETNFIQPLLHFDKFAKGNDTKGYSSIFKDLSKVYDILESFLNRRLFI